MDNASRPNQPSIDLLSQLESEREETTTAFQTDRDFDAQNLWVKEQVTKLGAPVHLIPIATVRDPQGEKEAPGVDLLYGDTLDPQIIMSPEELSDAQLNLRCIVEHNPSSQTLKKYGIDEERDVIFHFAKIMLQDAGLVVTNRFRGIDIGDMIVWDGTWYKVDSPHRSAYFGK